MPTGYCTVTDVRRALQETVAAFDSGDLGESDYAVVVDAIASQTEWVMGATDRHWYVPGGLAADDHNLIPTGVNTHTREEHTIPSTPHAGPAQMQVAAAKQARYPLRNNGVFTRIRLDKHYARSLTELRVRTASGAFTDWLAADSYTEGQDYELYADAGPNAALSYVNLRSRRLPQLADYTNAVRVSYDYGRDELSRTIRRAVAMRAAAQLLAPDDEATLAIPENANLQAVETKVAALERQADELMEVYR